MEENNIRNKEDLELLGKKLEIKEKVNCIRCTLSLIDKGKAIFVTENDTIFSLPSAVLNTRVVVGNSYLFIIDKILDLQNKIETIENIQNKYINKDK